MTRPFARIVLDGAAADFDAASGRVPGLCDEAQFLLRLVAAFHGRKPGDMLDRLVAREAQRIGIAQLVRSRRALAAQKPDLMLVDGGERQS